MLTKPWFNGESVIRWVGARSGRCSRGTSGGPPPTPPPSPSFLGRTISSCWLTSRCCPWSMSTSSCTMEFGSCTCLWRTCRCRCSPPSPSSCGPWWTTWSRSCGIAGRCSPSPSPSTLLHRPGCVIRGGSCISMSCGSSRNRSGRLPPPPPTPPFLHPATAFGCRCTFCCRHATCRRCRRCGSRRRTVRSCRLTIIFLYFPNFPSLQPPLPPSFLRCLFRGDCRLLFSSHRSSRCSRCGSTSPPTSNQTSPFRCSI